MEMNTKVILTAKWWTDNKAKTLKDKGKLEQALKNYGKVAKSWGGAKGEVLMKALMNILASLDALDKAADTNIKACVKGVHNETKHVLSGAFKKDVEAERKQFIKRKKDLLKEAGSLTFKKIYGDMSWRVLFLQFAKKVYISENINFLIAVEAEKKKNKKTYEMFIKLGAKQELNLSKKTRDNFKNAFEKGDKPTKGDWNDAIETTKQYIRSGGYLSHKFPDWFEEGCEKGFIK